MHLRSLGTRALALIVVTSGLVVLAAWPVPGAVRQSTVVSANPVNVTPNLVADDAVPRPAVYALHQIGDTVYAGGRFRIVADATRTRSYTRHNLIAFDARTGTMRAFAPTFNGAVWALASSGSSVYVGGYFSTVNGVERRGLVKLDATTGAVDPAFKPTVVSFGYVTEMRLRLGRLFVGGSFPERLVALDPVTGSDTGYIDLDITGSVAANAGPTDIYRFAIGPGGSRLVAIGNMTTVAGQSRRRAFMLNLGTTSATLSPWYYKPLGGPCSSPYTPAYLRDVDFSPDGQYFVLVSTGSVPLTATEIGTAVCDAAARFETGTLAPSKPTWINYTGGDTLHSVAVTGAAVYVQGHQRWLDNPEGHETAGPGAVSRRGIGAINPETGKALAWNPGKTRGVGGRDLLATSSGLWVGSDGARFNGEYRHGIAFCPM